MKLKILFIAFPFLLFSCFPFNKHMVEFEGKPLKGRVKSVEFIAYIKKKKEVWINAEYDKKGNLLKMDHAVEREDGAHISSFEYFYEEGNLIRMYGKMGEKLYDDFKYIYDKNGRKLKESIDYFGSMGNNSKTINFLYNDQGLLEKEISCYKDRPYNCITTEYRWLKPGLVKSKSEYSNINTLGKKRYIYEYNPNNQLIKTIYMTGEHADTSLQVKWVRLRKYENNLWKESTTFGTSSPNNKYYKTVKKLNEFQNVVSSISYKIEKEDMDNLNTKAGIFTSKRNTEYNYEFDKKGNWTKKEVKTIGGDNTVYTRNIIYF